MERLVVRIDILIIVFIVLSEVQRVIVSTWAHLAILTISTRSRHSKQLLLFFVRVRSWAIVFIKLVLIVVVHFNCYQEIKVSDNFWDILRAYLLPFFDSLGFYISVCWSVI